MGTAEVMTDAGLAYIKALGNPQGPHPLACEWVCTQLARWFGLPTFDFAILLLEKIDGIPFRQGGVAQPGPAFLTRHEAGDVWSGMADELNTLDNPEDVAKLVVFDTWVINHDRHPPVTSTRKPNLDNVFLSSERASEGRKRLIAMDHTHCLTCGLDLTERIATIGRIKDERVYGLFPGFIGIMREHREIVRASANVLRGFDQDTCRTFVDTIPDEWEVALGARSAMCDLICRRAVFVADRVEEWLAPTCWPQGEFDFEADGEGR